ncbi:helix-turn-helix transcriptional regulator [Halobacillus mangrovi]|uniref:helix-turn-helix transcriptional regulator n=1 Tax=Halobacillus mangrovi TaxID=402384 RepID=UPI003D961D8C
MKREFLIKIRKSFNWSQKQVVYELEVKYSIKITSSYYGMIEQGVRSPNLHLAIAISKLFNTDIENIFLINNATKSCI